MGWVCQGEGGVSGRFLRGNGGDIRRPIEVGSMDLVELFCWHVNATIVGTCGGVVIQFPPEMDEN